MLLPPGIIIVIGITTLILLIAWAKWHPFLALVCTALCLGWLAGMPLLSVISSIKTGIGGLLGDLSIVLVIGALLGNLIAATGAAASLTHSLTHLLGEKKLPWVLMLTGLLVGIPLFYNVGFVLLVPLAFALSKKTGMQPVFLALPMLAALSVTHGFLPPHPSPSAIAVQLGANPADVLRYGICIAIPAILTAGPLFSSRFKNWKTKVPDSYLTYTSVNYQPNSWISFCCTLLPAILLAVVNLPAEIALLISLGVAIICLWLPMPSPKESLTKIFSEAITTIAPILFIIAGAGALKQILVDTGASIAIGKMMLQWNLPPLVLAWTITAIIRICIGSATVAGLTAASLLGNFLSGSNISPALMVLSIGAGSLCCSHVNDSGFWMFKAYFNLTVKETLLSWTIMETIVSVVGLLGVLCLQAIL
ncbi:MAG: GntP family permease [Sediminibacterium sp.]